jgi:hypothetical protein
MYLPAEEETAHPEVIERPEALFQGQSEQGQWDGDEEAVQEQLA